MPMYLSSHVKAALSGNNPDGAVPNSGHTFSHRGFSITELLVAIGVIGILAALLIVMMGGVTEMRNKTVSGSNLRQIGVAINLYAQDDSSRMLPPFWASRYSTSGTLNKAFKRVVDKGFVDSPAIFMAPNDVAKTATIDESGWAQHPEAGIYVNEYSSYHYIYVHPGTRDALPAGPAAVESALKPRFSLFNDPDVIIAFEQWQTAAVSAYNKDGGIHVLRLNGKVDYINKEQFPATPTTAMFRNFESAPQ